jgi:hypothetical protein
MVDFLQIDVVPAKDTIQLYSNLIKVMDEFYPSHENQQEQENLLCGRYHIRHGTFKWYLPTTFI